MASQRCKENAGVGIEQSSTHGDYCLQTFVAPDMGTAHFHISNPVMNVKVAVSASCAGAPASWLPPDSCD